MILYMTGLYPFVPMTAGNILVCICVCVCRDNLTGRTNRRIIEFNLQNARICEAQRLFHLSFSMR